MTIGIKWKTCCSILCIIIILWSISVEAIRSTCQNDIWNSLFSHQPLLAITSPLANNTDTLIVRQQFWLVDIIELIEQEETFVTSWLSSTTWVDPRLSWNPANFDNCTWLSLPGTFVYLPDIGIFNSHSVLLMTKLLDPTNRVYVTSDGAIEWFTEGLLSTSCTLDITYYPFDYQTCHIHIGSTSLKSSAMSLLPYENDTFNLDYYRKNAVWDIVNTSVVSGQSVGGDYLKFYIFLRRKPSYTVLSLILPIVVLSMLSLAVFWLPAVADEKVSLSVTIFLSFIVFNTVIVATLPQSDNMPLLGKYYLATTLYAALTCLATIMVLNIHHTSHQQRPARIFHVLVRAYDSLRHLCCCCCSRTDSYTVSKTTSVFELEAARHNGHCTKPFTNELESTTESNATKSELQSAANHIKNIVNLDRSLEDYLDDRSIRSDAQNNDRIIEDAIDASRRQVHNQYFGSSHEPSWRAIATALDRCFFVIFFVAHFLTIIVCFAIIPQLNQSPPASRS